MWLFGGLVEKNKRFNHMENTSHKITGDSEDI
jgi:hypothetical protein